MTPPDAAAILLVQLALQQSSYVFNYFASKMAAHRSPHGGSACGVGQCVAGGWDGARGAASRVYA